MVVHSFGDLNSFKLSMKIMKYTKSCFTKY